MHNFKIDVGKRIRSRRELLGLLQPALAELSGVSRRTIQLVEQGSANPSMETLQKIIVPLGLTLQVTLRDPGNISTQ